MNSRQLLQGIQDSIIDQDVSLASVLLKCKVLGAQLGSKTLEDWLICESNGYPLEATLPDYRTWPLQLRGHFSGPFGSGMRNATIPALSIPENLRDSFTNFGCRTSVASIEQSLTEAESGILTTSCGDLMLVLGTNVYQGQNCIAVWGEFPKGHLVELLNFVRNRVLDFVLAVARELRFPDEAAKGEAVLTSGQVTQIFNTTVLGGEVSVLGSAINSKVLFGVRARDLESLASALEARGVTSEDIAELKTALAAEPSPPTKKTFGPRVSDWLSRMVGKAASGVWSIGVEAAGSFLGSALTHFYGP